MKKNLLLSLCLAMAGGAAFGVNPFLPLWEHIPDGEPYVFEDPDQPGKYRVYVYGSHDSLVTEYCGREQVVWSASVDSLDNWRYDGVIFESVYDANGNPLNPGGVGDLLYAPDVAMSVDANGKKTYWLYPNNQHGGRNGMVAKADRPDGPFVVTNWSKENPTETVGDFRFDPATFVDDDGRVYCYWGFDESWGAELDPATMATVKPGTQAVKDMVSSRQQDGDFRFFEASSIRKIKDKYVFIYSRWTADGEFGLPGTNYTLAYAYSDNPLGPFTYGGTIIDGRARKQLADGTTIATATPAGNTHGSICEINGKWWVFYHRQSGLDEFSRQAMVAPIEVIVEEGPRGKVVISEGEYTSEGFQTAGLDLYAAYPAGIACYYTGPGESGNSFPNFYFSGSYMQPTYYDGDPRTAPSDIALGSSPVVNNTSGSVVGYKYFNFDTVEGRDKVRFFVDLVPRGIPGKIEVYVGAPSEQEGGRKLGEIKVNKADPIAKQRKMVPFEKIGDIKGKQPLYFVFYSDMPGASICDLYAFGFER